MDATSRLQFPYILAEQEKKHLTHNAALTIADVLVQLAVKSRALTVAPLSPSEGDVYLVAAGASGDWAGNEHRITAWQGGIWRFYAPNAGWSAYVEDEDLVVSYSGGAWRAMGQGGASLDHFGIHTDADATNRLAVASTAALFTHDGAGHQIKVNKAATANTASVLFQTNWSGRAEFGLTGDDNWHVKVSQDGSTWIESLVVAAATGFVKLGTGAGTPNASLHVLDGASGSYVKPFKVHAPNMVAGNTCQFAVGRGETTIFDQAEFNYVYVGSGSSSNYFSIGLFGLPTIAKFDGTGAVSFPFVATTANAANAYLNSGASNSLMRSTSSEVYKRDIEPVEAARAHAVMAAQPIWYRSKSAADNPDWSWYGFSAEAVAEIDPRMVIYGYHDDDYEIIEFQDDDGAEHREKRLKSGAELKPDGVAYERFVVHHHLILNELVSRIEALEARLRQD